MKQCLQGKKKAAGPVHITTKETVSAGDDKSEVMDEETFAYCKEMMRPVKKALRQLDNPDEDLSEKDQLVHTRKCLLKIGDHINYLITKTYKNIEDIKKRRK